MSNSQGSSGKGTVQSQSQQQQQQQSRKSGSPSQDRSQNSPGRSPHTYSNPYENVLVGEMSNNNSAMTSSELSEIPRDYLAQLTVLKHLAKEVQVCCRNNIFFSLFVVQCYNILNVLCINLIFFKSKTKIYSKIPLEVPQVVTYFVQPVFQSLNQT